MNDYSEENHLVDLIITYCELYDIKSFYIFYDKYKHTIRINNMLEFFPKSKILVMFFYYKTDVEILYYGKVEKNSDYIKKCLNLILDDKNLFINKLEKELILHEK